MRILVLYLVNLTLSLLANLGGLGTLIERLKVASEEVVA
jgi:hypothetical protein